MTQPSNDSEDEEGPDVIVFDAQEAASYIGAAWEASGAQVLRLDGFPGAGKSTVAELVEEDFPGAHRFNIDDYELNGGSRRKHLARIDLQRLQSEVTQALTSGEKLILEGVCLEDILPSADFGAGFTVYVKRVQVIGGRDFMWRDGSYIGISQEADDPLLQDVIDYHNKFRPHIVATLIIALPEGE